MIVCYFRNPDTLGDSDLLTLLSQLPLQQRQIVEKMKSRRHRCEQVIAYTMLCNALVQCQGEVASERIVLREFLDAPLSMPDIEPPLWDFGEHGKPYMTNHAGFHFNISHCREAVAVGVGTREIGIDIEGRRRYSDTLLQRAFSDEEQAVIRASADPELAFSRLWTRKEAFFKWTGTGILMEHLKTIEDEAQDASCCIDTQFVDEGGFFLSVAFGFSS